ncbi:MAG TPA: phosphatidylserine/phosphatidylglycerophosphate/cardiolipin synthase family protein [Rhizomicrobium sp.]|nr:phosphatidylserine/phosphatidylglycerophosphate/cardiolipin synthase family protein [Rhizomicrobium sp.]
MSVALPSHIPSVESGSYPVRGGNRLRALVDGEAAFGRICEAVEGAKKSVWATIAFHDMDFRMPGGHGSLFDVLDRARARGIDVRAIFWRTEHVPEDEHFFGTAEQHAWLESRGSKFLARWDRGQKTYCQHQKSWLVDAGEPGETAFVGGINLMPSSVCAPGHANRDGRHTHDVYLEIRGPSATDVHHNFVQRWNEASERHLERGAWPNSGPGGDLPFPTTASPARGNAIVQMQRTVRAGHYSDETATPGGRPLPIAKGEFSIFDQYVKAIDAARSAIYVEDQYVLSADIVERLKAALARGVDVVFLCPATPEAQVVEGMRHARAAPLRALVASLGEHPNFALVGIASPRTGAHVYIHDKIMLVDDCWATIGSCNIASRSFFGDTELNAAIWDEDFVRALRVELLQEHLGIDTGRMEARDALALYREAARANAQARHRGEPMRGLAFALDPASYAA